MAINYTGIDPYTDYIRSIAIYLFFLYVTLVRKQYELVQLKIVINTALRSLAFHKNKVSCT